MDFIISGTLCRKYWGDSWWWWCCMFYSTNMHASGGSTAQLKIDTYNNDLIGIKLLLYFILILTSNLEEYWGLCNPQCTALPNTHCTVHTHTYTQQSVGAVLQASKPQPEVKLNMWKLHFRSRLACQLIFKILQLYFEQNNFNFKSITQYILKEEDRVCTSTIILSNNRQWFV